MIDKVGASQPWTGRRIHFIGIGGCGMSGLAMVASQLGAHVSGSDMKRSIFIDSLLDSGIADITIGQSVDNVPFKGDIVYSSAIQPENVERTEAKRRGLKQLHRSALLAELTRMHRTVAVAGAHGKTTTTALLAYVLTQGGLDPTYIVGGLMRKPALHARAGHGNILVIEADESDRSLLEYDVDLAVITNVDLDHVGDAAGYHSKSDVAQTLARFAKGGELVFGSGQASSELGASVSGLHVVQPKPSPQGSNFFVLHGETYELSLPGWHNIENAALVVAVASQLGLGDAAIQAALRDFPGLARRFELRGRTAGGARVYDDYAHHPTEVEAVLKAARSITPGQVIAVFQPHLFSRTQQFMDDFANALSSADRAFVEPIYAARENPAAWSHVSSEAITAIATKAGHEHFADASSRDQLVAELKATASEDDTIVLIGAGDIGSLTDGLTV